MALKFPTISRSDPRLLAGFEQTTAHPPRLNLAAGAMENVKSDVFRKNQTEENMAYASIILHIVPPAVVLGTRSTWNERYVPATIIALPERIPSRFL